MVIQFVFYLQLTFLHSKGKSDWQWDHFEVSVPMSTYLVAYSVNSFEYREAVVKMENDVVFRIYARPDAIDQVILILQKHVINHFNSH